MYNREQIQKELDEIKSKYGEWNFDIPLPYGIWTKGNLGEPHTRLKRIVQIINDLSKKPISECRILDLGCSDGMFSIEFAMQGANTIGVEAREGTIKKAIFSKDVLGLKNLEFRQDDVRKVSVKSYGQFDIIVCSGIFYHLSAEEAFNLVSTMFEMTNRLLVLDVRVAFEAKERVLHEKNEYWGAPFQEHPEHATAQEKEKRVFYSLDNTYSFWFTRPSLINLLSKAGFSSIYECYFPIHKNFGKSGIHHKDHLTFIAIKDKVVKLNTSPTANSLNELWPEGSLTYAPEMPKPWYKKM